MIYPWVHICQRDGGVIGATKGLEFEGNLINPNMLTRYWHMKIDCAWATISDHNIYDFGAVRNPDGTIKHKYRWYVDMPAFFSAASLVKIQSKTELVWINTKLRPLSLLIERT